MARSNHRLSFVKQRIAARSRGIGWGLTFEQWLNIWLESGKLELRGCKKGQYVMARIRDRGPYATGNVNIILAEQNASEGQVTRDEQWPDWKEKQRASLTGRKLSAEHRAAIGAAHKGMKRSEQTRKNISTALKGKKVGKEHREAISRALRGGKLSAAVRASMSRGQKLRQQKIREAKLTQRMRDKDGQS